MQCPKCKTEMELWTQGQLEVDRCTACGGVFLDKGELEQVDNQNLGAVIDNANHDRKERSTEGALAHCHRCDVAMMPLTGADDIEFDWCEKCEGMYFDAGELKRFDVFEA